MYQAVISVSLVSKVTSVITGIGKLQVIPDDMSLIVRLQCLCWK